MTTKGRRLRCVSGIDVRLKSYIALYGVNTSHFLFEEREIVATFVDVLHRLIRT